MVSTESMYVLSTTEATELLRNTQFQEPQRNQMNIKSVPMACKQCRLANRTHQGISNATVACASHLITVQIKNSIQTVTK